MKQRGYTLIEVLVALFVFAILSAITAQTMHQAFDTRSRLNATFEALNKLQLAIAMITTDTQTMIDRSSMGNDMHIFPPFTGQRNYFEYTRDGLSNPEGIAVQSSLKRIAYLCLDDKLIRRTWEYVDTPHRQKVQNKILLERLTQCRFAYLAQNHQILNEWQAYAVQQNQKKANLPLAIQVSFQWNKSKKVNLLFAIPEALYAE